MYRSPLRIRPGVRLRVALMCLAWLLPGLAPLQASASGPAPAGGAYYSIPFQKQPSARAMTELGRMLFFDPALSASGRMACASCHDPKFAFGPPNGRAVQLGGPGMNLAGTRAVPSLRYIQNVPAFTEHYYEDDGNDSVDLGPTGGHTWDGRAQSTHDQARLPLLSPLEMANAGPEQVVAKVRAGSYAEKFRDTYGDNVFADPQLAFKGVQLALEVYQQTPEEFYPYDSKYDAWLRRKAELTPQEQRGLALFNNPAKGNCATCHPSSIRSGAFPGFTDFGYVAVGVPRNPAIPANRKPGYYDLGLCGPARSDFRDRAEYCGLFRAPSLRNVTRRKVFFHNGVFHSLEQVLRFYATRDTDPGKWYPRKADGSIDQFNDLPPQYRGNVNRDPPFGGKPGGKPVLGEQDIRDLIAFLGTLDDGYQPQGQAPAR
jgi:cytochrome c peroxidase